jgi:hypothetical protein
VSPEAVQVVGDTIVVTAPVPPGVKQLVFTYEIAADRELTVPIDQPAERLLVLVEDTTATVIDGPLARRGVQVFNDAQFAVFDGVAASGGEAMVFGFDRHGLPGSTMTLVVVGTAALLLFLAVPLLARRRTGVTVVAPPDSPDSLARAIALLDAEHQRQPDRSPAADEAYRHRRATLKAQLTDALARRRAGS